MKPRMWRVGAAKAVTHFLLVLLCHVAGCSLHVAIRQHFAVNRQRLVGLAVTLLKWIEYDKMQNNKAVTAVKNYLSVFSIKLFFYNFFLLVKIGAYPL